MDPRLRAAVDSSLAWYDALCALHGVGCVVEDGLWSATSAPPPLHSAVKTVEPGVDPARAARRARGLGGVADSFGDLSLDAHGFGLLLEAQWIHRSADDRTVRGLAPGWSIVRTPELLAAWTARHDTTSVLLPGLLQRSAFAVLARDVEEGITAGVVLHGGTGVVSISNAWAVGDLDPWPELVVNAASLWPGRDVVGYEWGADLDAAREVGFAAVGPQLVWV